MRLQLTFRETFYVDTNITTCIRYGQVGVDRHRHSLDRMHVHTHDSIANLYGPLTSQATIDRNRKPRFASSQCPVAYAVGFQSAGCRRVYIEFNDLESWPTGAETRRRFQHA